MIVTASKRKANLQDLPQAITAFTTDDIERQALPAWTTMRQKFPASPTPRVNLAVPRWCSAAWPPPGFNLAPIPPPAFTSTSKPITQAGLNPDPRLIDIERVEALSGPRARCSRMAHNPGTLRIITNKPDPMLLEGWVEGTAKPAEHSSDQDTDISGMVNIRLWTTRLASAWWAFAPTRRVI